MLLFVLAFESRIAENDTCSANTVPSPVVIRIFLS